MKKANFNLKLLSYCKSCIDYKHSEGNKLSMDLSSTHIFVKRVSVLS
jgi:hypothetical protein